MGYFRTNNFQTMVPCFVPRSSHRAEEKGVFSTDSRKLQSEKQENDILT